MNDATTSYGSLDLALDHARRLIPINPAMAVDQAREILKAVPAHPEARLILGAAYRITGQVKLALEILDALTQEYPQVAAPLLELAVALSEAGRCYEAVKVLRCGVTVNPDSADGWRLLADHLDSIDEKEEADQARARYLRVATLDPRLLGAASALMANDLPAAESLLRAHLGQHTTDIAAIRMLAEVAARLRRYADAQALLERCLILSPSFDAARHQYAVILSRQGNVSQALCQVEMLLRKSPRDTGYRNLQAAILASLGDYAASIEVYEAVLRDHAEQPKIWLSYGHALKTAARTEDSIAAYRRAIALDPLLGEAFWSLANLKTFRLSQDDIAAIRSVLERKELPDEDRLHFEFALGKGLEDEACFEQSFKHYTEGNRIRRRLQPYSADYNAQIVQKAKSVLTPEFFASRARAGADSAEPIFIVGLPRSGSTLLEQILASHTLVEGTRELPDVPQIAHDLARRGAQPQGDFLDSLQNLNSDELRRLGERYLSTTRAHRKASNPYFVDKMPNNWLYVGLIQLILPGAKIIDARRHPLGCCLSGFKQHFARGQQFAYDLGDIGRYYRDYVELMAHFDDVLPDRIHRVFYEELINNTEGEVRRLLAYCGLNFENGCLRFYENDRAVRTASAEQVRRPIFREGLEQWRHFEPWLSPLKEALGTVLLAYPGIPEFSRIKSVC